MVLVKCKACSKRYDYHQHGCCPECGAYNRPPQRNRVGADGAVHHMNDADFLDNTQRRRNSQSGKVCFERDVCFEDQTRRVRSGEKPWAKMVEEAASHLGGTARSDRREKSGTRKIIGIVISVILATNVLPLLLTMCSASGVVGEIVDELFGSEVHWDKPVEEVVPAIPDLTGIPTISPGQTFLWWDANACVTELTVNEADQGTKVDLTLRVEDPQDKPTVWYQMWDGEWVEGECEYVSKLSDGHYTYYFYLPERLPGSESFVLFAGQTGDVWCRSKLPLTEGVGSDLAGDVITMDRFFVDMLEPFLWWDQEVWVEGADIVEADSTTEILLTLRDGVDFDAPSIVYWNENGEQVSTMWYDEYSQWEDGQQDYRFFIWDRQEGSDCWAVFTDSSSAEHGAVWVLLTDALQAQPAESNEELQLRDLTIEPYGNDTEIKVTVQRDFAASDVNFAQPTLHYTDVSGKQQKAEARSSNYNVWSGDATYTFRVKNMEEGSALTMCFVDQLGIQPTITVPLN